MTSSGAIARFVRLKVVPLLLPVLFRSKAVRRFMFRTVSQTAVNYRTSPLSAGRAGKVVGGDRLPWVAVKVDGVEQDNYAPLALMDWGIHVYGEAAPDLHALCVERRLPLHVFPWRREMSRTGLRRDAVYLVRPDGYVALADGSGGAAALRAYLDSRGVTPAR